MNHVPVGMPGFWQWYLLALMMVLMFGGTMHLVTKQHGGKSTLPIACFGVTLGMLIVLNTPYSDWFMHGAGFGGILWLVIWQKLDPKVRAWRNRKSNQPPANPPAPPATGRSTT